MTTDQPRADAHAAGCTASVGCMSYCECQCHAADQPRADAIAALTVEVSDGAWEYDPDTHHLTFTDRDPDGYGATAVVAFDVQPRYASLILQALAALAPADPTADLRAAALALLRRTDGLTVHFTGGVPYLVVKPDWLDALRAALAASTTEDGS